MLPVIINLAQLFVFRLLIFEDVQIETKLTNVTTFDLAKVRSHAECIQRCTIRPKCKSINICHKKFCQLNSDDRFSKGVHFQYDSNCVYTGMFREFIPVCKEKGQLKEITDDVNPGLTKASFCLTFKAKISVRYVSRASRNIDQEGL